MTTKWPQTNPLLTFGQCFRKFYLFIKTFVTTRKGRLTSDVVLFLTIAFKTLDISQGSVATHSLHYDDNEMATDQSAIRTNFHA